MLLISILIALVIVGIVLWFIENAIPINGTTKTILNVVVLIIVVVWLLSSFGIISSYPNIYIDNLRVRL